uniref:Uncharacterized protein n=1 Tax=Cyanophora sudae TaxID=1522369 RepID=A0A873WRX3_9EUKA|nr:hypothetical protein DXZ12_mgp25 [Cyanophora sudae]QPB15085.1 hypothetical protein [Cyanophora sudae]
MKKKYHIATKQIQVILSNKCSIFLPFVNSKLFTNFIAINDLYNNIYWKKKIKKIVK